MSSILAMPGVDLMLASGLTVMSLSTDTQRRRRRRPVARVARLAAHLQHPLDKSNRSSGRLARRNETIVRLLQISPQKRAGLSIERNLPNSRARRYQRQRQRNQD
jgi:hypothetical protein